MSKSDQRAMCVFVRESVRQNWYVCMSVCERDRVRDRDEVCEIQRQWLEGELIIK